MSEQRIHDPAPPQSPVKMGASFGGHLVRIPLEAI